MFDNAIDAKTFLLAGNSTITLESTKTAKHFTFRVKRPKDKDIAFVSVLTGPSNETDYTYIGIMGANETLVLTKKSKMTAESIPVRAFNYMMDGLKEGKIRENLNISHSGKCGRCNRLLTTPTSLASGIGPECAKKV